VAQARGPEFKPQYNQKKKREREMGHVESHRYHCTMFTESSIYKKSYHHLETGTSV
jgi:hypothetical protein